MLENRVAVVNSVSGAPCGTRHSLLAAALIGLIVGQLLGCGDEGGGKQRVDAGQGDRPASGDLSSTEADVNSQAESDASRAIEIDGSRPTADSGTPGAGYVVSMVQSSKETASAITQDEVAEMVARAVAQAGGLDFIRDGQTVVLKPNIVTPYANRFGTVALDPQVNGVTTDWRVTKAVADLVRARNPSGKILVMEGSVAPSSKAFAAVGYTQENFGTAVDEFLGFEGGACRERNEDLVVQRIGANGKTYWLNKRYATADVVISIPVMKTHSTAGITGGVKNLGIGTTPAGWYSATTAQSSDCTRGQTPEYIDHTSAATLGQFIHDYYSLRPADFVVMDGLQGLQNGPSSMWSGTDYATDKMNMRLILAGRNAVAVDTIETLVMKCDPTKVPYLTLLEADGLGTTDVSKIKVVGKQVIEVAKAFAGKQTAICPGPPVLDAGIDGARLDTGKGGLDGRAGQDGPAQDRPEQTEAAVGQDTGRPDVAEEDSPLQDRG
jgi:uncharacterized protein (DUF362 family)